MNLFLAFQLSAVNAVKDIEIYMKKIYTLFVIAALAVMSCAPSKPTIIIDCSCHDSECQIQKNGEPSFRYKDEFKSACFGYKGSSGDVAHNCFESGCGWSSEFHFPDTTETIGISTTNTIRTMFLENYYKVFDSKNIQNNQVQIYVLPSFEKEMLITIDLESKKGGIIQPCDSSGWAEMNVKADYGGYVQNANEYNRKQGLCNVNKDLSSLIEHIVQYPIYEFGDISKNGIMMMDGTTIIVRAKINNNELYSEFSMVPWYDIRYDSISKAIEEIVKGK